MPDQNRNAGQGDRKGRFAYGGLERIFHEKARLGILTSLATHSDGLLFLELKELCALTDGNLSRHLQTLQEAGFIQVWKGQQGGRPQTLCQLTSEGRERFVGYLHELERVVRDAMNGSPVTGTLATGSPAAGSPGGGSPGGGSPGGGRLPEGAAQ